MMNCDQTFLNIDSGSQFCGRTQQDPDRPGIKIPEDLLSSAFVFSVVNESDLCSGNSLLT